MRTGRTKRLVESGAGFTAVEVLVAMTLFAIGAAGVIAMQRAAVQANAEARRVDVATGIAHAWTERLRRDATMWTLPRSPLAAGFTGHNNSTLGTPGHFKNARVLDDLRSNLNTWRYPNQYQPATRTVTTPPDGLSPAFDTLGRDLARDEEVPIGFFCVQLRGIWLGGANDQQTPPTYLADHFNDLLRVEVRVFWPRGLLTASLPGQGCAAANLAAASTTPEKFQYVYLATAVRQNALP
jgi:prepilin-type N-terminal cleavage/methylation domain-containing protein